MSSKTEVHQLELSLTEASRRAELEQVIELGLATFISVGNALLEIRDSKLYRDTHATFEDYCRQRWEMSRQRAHQLIDASEVARNLSTIVDTAPTHESQVRPLTGLPAEQQRAAWTEATRDTPQPTAKKVAAAVDTVKKNGAPAIDPKEKERLEKEEAERSSREFATKKFCFLFTFDPLNKTAKQYAKELFGRVNFSHAQIMAGNISKSRLKKCLKVMTEIEKLLK